jgi:sugar lactone lactonase YvrE
MALPTGQTAVRLGEQGMGYRKISAISVSACGLLAASAVLLNATSTRGDVLLGCDSFTGDLLTIDPTTGSGSVAANLGIRPVGLAHNPATGVTYVRDFFNLYTLDTATLSTTLIGPAGFGVSGLTFNATHTHLFSVDQITRELHRIDPATGASVIVGSTGATGSPLDLALSPWGAVYMHTFEGDLFEVNLATGASTLVASAGVGLTSIEFAPDGTLLGVTDTDQLVRLNLSGGHTLVGGPVGAEDVRGMLFVPGPGAAGLCGAAMLAGLARGRRRR